MDGERDRDPLVLLDAAVIVGVQVREVVLLLEGVLLDVEARAVDMGAKDVDAAREVLNADLGEDQRLAAHGGIDAIARLQGSAFGDA